MVLACADFRSGHSGPSVAPNPYVFHYSPGLASMHCIACLCAKHSLVAHLYERKFRFQLHSLERAPLPEEVSQVVHECALRLEVDHKQGLVRLCLLAALNFSLSGVSVPLKWTATCEC